MTPEQIVLIRTAFAQVLPTADAALSYSRLFELDASLQPMFKGDMAEQDRKLMTMLNVVVNVLTRLETLVPTLQSLGRQHAGYGGTHEHRATVGESFLWTLLQGLGERFTPTVAAASSAAFALLADVMKAAAELDQVMTRVEELAGHA
jgi:hemoglobin-like flavoprotein